MNPIIRKTAAASLIASGVLFANSVVVMPSDNNTIQVALLLDTSNSMDGLIEQAKSRLWNIVNTLTTLKYDGQTPKIRLLCTSMVTMTCPRAKTGYAKSHRSRRIWI